MGDVELMLLTLGVDVVPNVGEPFDVLLVDDDDDDVAIVTLFELMSEDALEEEGAVPLVREGLLIVGICDCD